MSLAVVRPIRRPRRPDSSKYLGGLSFGKNGLTFASKIQRPNFRPIPAAKYGIQFNILDENWPNSRPVRICGQIVAKELNIQHIPTAFRARFLGPGRRETGSLSPTDGRAPAHGGARGFDAMFVCVGGSEPVDFVAGAAPRPYPMVARTTRLTPLRAMASPPSRVGVMLRTTPPPDEIGRLWSRSLRGSKRASTLGV